MTIFTRRNTAFTGSDGNALWFQFMEDLITQGWRVLGSGDGVSFENSGQKVVGASNGRLVTPDAASFIDGETFILDDGVLPAVTFEIDTVPDGVSGGNVVVDISGDTTEFDVRDTIITAINSATLGITAQITARAGLLGGGDPVNTAALILMNNVTGAGGNTTSSETVADADFTVTNMAGGGLAAGGSGGIYHLFTSAPAVDTSSPWTGGLWSNTNPFAADNRGASWIRIVTPSDADHYAEMLFQLSFTGSSNDEDMFVAVCRDTQRFDNGADQWQRPAVNSGVAIRLGNTRGAEDFEVHLSGTASNQSFLPSIAGHGHWVIGDSAVDYDFFFYANRDNPSVVGEVFSDFGRFRVVGGPGRSDGSVDPDPYVWLCGFESTSGATNHNFNNTDHLSLEDSTPVVGEERLEDRASATNGRTQTVASYGIDDPVVAANRQGHYGVHLIVGGITATSTQFFHDQWNATASGTGRTVVDTLIGVGRAHEDSTVTFKFYKGVLKNNLLGLSSKVRDSPVVQRGVDVSDPFRVSWGRFHIYWGAEEKVEGV